MHERGLIHKDIKPANILVDAASGGVWLTGFGIASRLPREHQAPAPPEVIAGTLAYMAPEQTGRMNRSVDSRSDLYALGVTFYEMLTGQLPFTAADPMEWVHCHIARQPVPPDERVADVPGPLSAIVMKLLAKTAEERYQTAAGVEADLRRCLAEWESHGRIDPFPLGTHDASDRLLIPEKLYGREREIDALLASFDRVVANGTLELVLVSGYSGIGKSSVVNELHKALVPPRGLFASGKFDQYKRDIPYATLAPGLPEPCPLAPQPKRGGAWPVAGLPERGARPEWSAHGQPRSRAGARDRETAARSGPAAAGRAEPLPDGVPAFPRRVRAQGASARAVPRRSAMAGCSNARPRLSIWSRIRRCGTSCWSAPTGTTRSAPLTRFCARWRRSAKPERGSQEIVLAPLELDDVGRLIADALHCEPERARPLAELVQEKTGGNPFFAIQFLTALAEEGLLAFDPVARAWQWDMDRIRAKGYTDNVVDLMVGKLKRLSATHAGSPETARLPGQRRRDRHSGHGLR